MARLPVSTIGINLFQSKLSVNAIIIERSVFWWKKFGNKLKMME